MLADTFSSHVIAYALQIVTIPLTGCFSDPISSMDSIAWNATKELYSLFTASRICH